MRKFFLFFLLGTFLQLSISLSQTPDPGSHSTQSITHDFAPAAFHFEHFGSEEGLNQQKITSILQDHQGFLWLGTDQGVVRYDGYTFRTFANNSGDSTSLSHNQVLCLFEDSQERLWVGTLDGLNLYNPRTERFIRIRTLPDHFGRTTLDNVNAICEDSSGAIWTANIIGLSRIAHIPDQQSDQLSSVEKYPDADHFSVTHLVPNPNEKEDFQDLIYSILIDSRGSFWIGGQYGLMRLLPSAKKGQNQSSDSSAYTFDRLYERFGDEVPALKTDILRLLEDDEGIVWAKTRYALLRIDPPESPSQPVSNLVCKTYSFTDKLFEMGAFYQTSGPEGRRIWINLPDVGFMIFDPAAEKFINIPGDGGTDSLIPFSIEAIYKDRSGITWFGTNAGGLFKFDPYLNRFNQFHPGLLKVSYNSTIDVRFVFEDSRGDLWIANDGVYRCDRRTGQVLSSFWTDRSAPDWKFKNKIAEDSRGYIWIGSEYGGLYRYDPFSQKMEHLSSLMRKQKAPFRFEEGDIDYPPVSGIGPGKVSENITALTCDGGGNLWAAARVDIAAQDNRQNRIFIIYHININTHKIRRYRLDKTLDPGSVLYFINTIHLESPNILWLGSGFGLIRFEPETGAIKVYQTDPQNPAGLSSNRIHAVAADRHQPQRYLWLGTDGGGLVRFDRQNESFQHYGIEEELPGTIVSSILIDRRGTLWLGTNRGLCNALVDSSTGDILQFRTFDKSDGIVDDDFGFFYGHNAHQNRAGDMFFAGAKGITVFNPDQISANPLPPPLVASDFYINYRRVTYGQPDSPLPASISGLNHIELSYKNNSFAIELAALDFHAPEKNRYAYILEGYQDDWVEAGHERRAVFTRVPPGRYVFRAKAANSDGVWNEKGLTLSIRIIPPWYRRWWAYGIYGLSLLGLLYVIRRFEKDRQRHKHQAELEQVEREKLQEMDRLKTDFFANISHEFRTPLTLILGPTEEMLKSAEGANKRNLSLIRRSSRRLLQLIDQLLDLSKLDRERLKLRAEPGDFGAFLNGLVMSFESLAERKGVHLRFTSDETLVEQEAWFDRDKIEKIFTNLLSNAFKFTPEGGEVSVTVQRAKECPFRTGDAEGHAHEFVHTRCLICLSEGDASAPGCLLITVADTGEGIPAEQLPHIFDRFYQADSSSRRVHGGTGIGLALVKELVEMHYGSIVVHSREGQGTTFHISLPLGKAHLKPEEIVEAEGQPAEAAADVEIEDKRAEDILEAPLPEEDDRDELAQDGRPILLIIEDNADVRAYIREQLQADYIILEAEDGQAGIDRAVEAIPDLVISDVMMPKKDGYEVCRTLKSDQRTSHIPIILLTAKARAEEKLAGLETGADAYVLKPFRQQELAVRVRNLIELRRKLRAKYSSATTIKPSEVDATPMDREFLHRVVSRIEAEMEDELFGPQELAGEIGLSLSQLNRKLKALIDQPAAALIRSMRLQRAADLLKANAGTVAEICFRVGFSDQTSFNRAFKKQFGCSPREYQKTH